MVRQSRGVGDGENSVPAKNRTLFRIRPFLTFLSAVCRQWPNQEGSEDQNMQTARCDLGM